MRYPLSGMPKSVPAVKAILRANVARLLDRDFPQHRNRRGQLMAFIAARRGFTRKNLSKLQRVTKEGSCNLMTVGQLAAAFGLDHAYQLFIHELDVEKPQVALSEKELARELETRLRALIRRRDEADEQGKATA